MAFSRRDFMRSLAMAPASTLRAANMPYSESCRVLDVPAAKLLIPSGLFDPEENPSSEQQYYYADLSFFTQVRPEAVEYLSQYTVGFVHFGIHALDQELADAIGQWKGTHFRIFENLRELDSNCASALVQSRCNLCLWALADLPEDVAKELSMSQGWLEFITPMSITAGVAKALSVHDSPIKISLSTEPSSEAAWWISQHKGHRFEMTFKEYPSQRLIESLSLNPQKNLCFSHHPASWSWEIKVCRQGWEQIL